MTRVNVGIEPRELCDQHLIAEYRELPRCLSYTTKVAIGLFRLGPGHVKWCAQFKGSLAMRQNQLIAEMKLRGFKPKFDTLIVPTLRHHYWTDEDYAYARPLLIARITTRLMNMRRATWTGFSMPDWSAK